MMTQLKAQRPFGLFWFLVAPVLVVTAGLLSSCQTTRETKSVMGDGSAAKSGVTAEQLHTIGRDMSLAFFKKSSLIEDEAVSLYINRVGQYVALHLDPGGKNIKCMSGRAKQTPSNGFRFGVVRSSERMAIGLPGGFVYVSSALVHDLRNEDELAGVLAHEATHIVCQDGLTEMEEALAGPVTEDIRTVAARSYEAFFKQVFSSQQEKVADRGALLGMYRAGYFPLEAIDFVGKLGERPMDRHPAAPERVAWMKKDFAKMQKKGVVNTQKARAARFAEFKKRVG